MEKTKFKVGHCIAFYTTIETEDGNTGDVWGTPSCKVTDYTQDVIGIRNGYYLLIDKNGWEHEQSVEHVDANYVRIKCK